MNSFRGIFLLAAISAQLLYSGFKVTTFPSRKDAYSNNLFLNFNKILKPITIMTTTTATSTSTAVAVATTTVTTTATTTTAAAATTATTPATTVTTTTTSNTFHFVLKLLL